MITFADLGRYGRIGNQMFQIAGTIGLAQKHGYEYAFPKWMNYDEKERFSGTEDIDIQQHFKNPLPLLPEDIKFEPFQVPWGFHDLEVPDWVSLKGHMQSEKYFEHCPDLIKHYFTFKHETEQQIDSVAVHFRGGDYLKHKNYHPPCSAEYYAAARNYFDGDFRFLLFTDDPEVASSVLPFQFELVEEEHPMKAMELMSKCDAHIIANSSFSWWGAWLANSRRVIAPSRWFGPDAAKLDTRDIYPKDWIVI